MKRHQYVFSSDREDPQYTKRINRDTKRVIWINVIGGFTLISLGVYAWEIREFGNDLGAFILRHGNFFGPTLLAFVFYLIYQKVRP